MKEDLIAKLQKDVADEQNHRDGIPQIAVGVFLVISMLLMMSGHGNTFVVFIPLIPVIIEGLRKRVTYPRVGYAKLKERTSSNKPLHLAILAALIAGAVVFFVRRLNPETLPHAENPHLLIMWAIAILIVLFGVVFIYRRRSHRFTWFIAIVPVILVAVFVFKLQRQTIYWVLLAFGAVQILLGMLKMRAFVRDYPVLKDDE